jgi:lysophospholipase L1-like esterase
MKRFITLCIVYAIFGSTGIVCAEVLIKPNDTNINYYGRFDFSTSSTTVKFNWPGTIIEASFPGPSIGVELTDGGAYFNVEIDGVLVDSLKPATTNRRTIRTNLSTTANHTIRITLRTNGPNCSFGGFYLADGKALAAKPSQPFRKIEFIGDSWTAGDVIGSTTSNGLQYFNAALTYARVTSRAFHAQDKLIARGGCGMVKSNGGAATMPTRYSKILCDGTTNWDFTSWIPELVVIFFGINDFNNGVADADFKTAYTGFINTIRGHYANVPIILIGLTDNINGHNILTDVQAVAQSFIKVFTFSSPVTLANAKALWQHPNQAQHHQIADALIPVVKQATGWDTVQSGNVTLPRKESRRVFSDIRESREGETIMVTSPLASAQGEGDIFDVVGHRIRHFAFDRQGRFKWDVSNAGPGLYLIGSPATGWKTVTVNLAPRR